MCSVEREEITRWIHYQYIKSNKLSRLVKLQTGERWRRDYFNSLSVVLLVIISFPSISIWQSIGHIVGLENTWEMPACTDKSQPSKHPCSVEWEWGKVGSDGWKTDHFLSCASHQPAMGSCQHYSIFRYNGMEIGKWHCHNFKAALLFHFCSKSVLEERDRETG